MFPADPSERRDLLNGIKYIEGKCRLPVRLIIFDTLARCYGNLDENNSQDMGRLIVGCDAIKMEHQPVSFLYIIQVKMKRKVPEAQVH